ncbi:MAG: hypothetical protein KDE27_06765 [Planctomycetes bacterium]|nr:hypothetical protein [Planctomycetota bacterium]
MAADVQRLAFAADEYYGVNGRWPTHAELLELDETLPDRDFLHQQLRFEAASDGGLQVRSPGVDGRFDTTDDIVSWSMKGGERFAERQRVAGDGELRR